MPADWETLQSAIDGGVVLAGSPDYDSVRKPAMVRFERVKPEAVVLCRTPEDVSAAIAFAREFGVQTAIRGGGHSVAGRSSTEGMVIDVTPMSSVSVDGEVAIVGAGARLGELYDALQEHGRTIAAGCGPSVGIAGLTLGGGLGILGRTYGLTCDNLIEAQVVLADGRVVDCDEQRDEDLFWALRGAGGGNFGVVTSFVFQTLAAPHVTVFHVTWPFARAAALADAWQAWAPSGPDQLDATLRMSVSSDGEAPVIDVVGAVLGSETDGAELVDDLIARAGTDPASSSYRHLPYRDAKRYLAELGTEDADEEPNGDLFTKSEFFRRPIPREMVTALVEILAEGPGLGRSRQVHFTPWGGAYNRVPQDATAFAHRDELFLVQHLLVIDPDAAVTDTDDARDWLRRSWALVHPWGSGRVYPNFPDPELEDWAKAYYGPNYDRLVRVKATYDPSGFFRFHQSL
ncbi:MAG TPA: FAD-binding oxidoreductase [Gaiellaceae bacterium]|nr:FAD-binding oxidoreductase [Gaiellaceae bacterium]